MEAAGLLVPLVIIVGGIVLLRSRARTKFYSRECPHCKERMRGDASVCPHCQRESVAWQQKDGRWWRQTDGGWEYLDTTGDPHRWRPFEGSAATREP